MKYSLSSRQTAEYLRKADEIKVQWRDRNIIPDLFEKYPEAKVNLVRYYQDAEEEIDWKQIDTFNVLGRGNFIIGLTISEELLEAQKRGYIFHYLYEVRTFQELNAIMRLGVCRIRLGAPLFFQMDKVKQNCGLPIVTTANLAYSDFSFGAKDGVTGTWIRPEDVNIYDQYIDTIEFVGNKTQEQALFRIYAEQGAWSGELGLVVQDLNYPCTNRMIPPDLATARLNCGQRCQETGRCHLCYRYMDLANPDKLSRYLASQEKN